MSLPQTRCSFVALSKSKNLSRGEQCHSESKPGGEFCPRHHNRHRNNRNMLGKVGASGSVDGGGNVDGANNSNGVGTVSETVDASGNVDDANNINGDGDDCISENGGIANIHGTNGGNDNDDDSDDDVVRDGNVGSGVGGASGNGGSASDGNVQRTNGDDGSGDNGFSENDISEEARAYAATIIQQKRDATRTGNTYVRHQRNYLTFAQGKGWSPLPVLPGKVALFIRHERNRGQYSGGGQSEKRGTTLGKDAVVQAITAIESLRKETAHRFLQFPAAQIPLRQNHDIKVIETDVKANEHKRSDDANMLKAAGSMADCETVAERLRVSTYFLSTTGNSSFEKAVRNRAMYLVSGAFTYRGDNTRPVQFSDLQFHTVPTKIPTEPEIETLIILSENGKTNKTGRQDHTGAIRHKNPFLCPIGGLALHLYVRFHLSNEEPPEFAPDFEKPGVGKYGDRDWYRRLLFTKGADNKAMSYQSHYNALRTVYQQTNIDLSKVTHAGRVFGARQAALGGTDPSDGKAQGLWEQGAYRTCYNTTIPTDVLKILAGTHKDSVHFVPRSMIDPPEYLTNTIFPWLEREEAKYEERKRENPLAIDISLRSLFTVLRYFRTVLVQDLPFLVEGSDDDDFRFKSLMNLPLVLSTEFKMWATKITTESRSLIAPPSAPGTQDYVEAVMPILSQIRAETNEKFDKLVDMLRMVQASITQQTPTGASVSTTVIPSIPGPVPASENTDDNADDEKSRKRDALREKYGTRLSEIPVIWKGDDTNGEWVPKYRLAKISWVEDAWREYEYGINGKISLRELDNNWGTKWRFGVNSLRVEYNRRMEVVNEVDRLRRQPHWNLDMALADLATRYTNNKIKFRKAVDDLVRRRLALSTPQPASTLASPKSQQPASPSRQPRPASQPPHPSQSNKRRRQNGT